MDRKILTSLFQTRILLPGAGNALWRYPVPGGGSKSIASALGPICRVLGGAQRQCTRRWGECGATGLAGRRENSVKEYPPINAASIVIENIVKMSDPEWREYHMKILYDGKQALLAVPVKTGHEAIEPGIPLCREELAQVAQALATVAESKAGILWQQ